MNWDTIKFGIGGAVAGSFVLFGIGFGWADWKFESKAEAMAEQAVVERLVPICVAQVKNDPMRKQKLAKLSALGFLEQTEFVEKQGWVTFPGSDKPSKAVSEPCLREIRFADFS